MEDSQTITLAPGQWTTVAFQLIPYVAGTYNVNVEGLTGTFVVRSPSIPYPYNKKAMFDTTALGAGLTENLINFPVCVHINAYSWPVKAERDHFFGTWNVGGKRCQFRDADVTTIIPYECEYYNATTQEAVYWVRAPQINPNSTADAIFAAYGQDIYSSDQENKHAVWIPSYKGVWHLHDASPGPMTDSTINSNIAWPSGTALQYQQGGHCGLGMRGVSGGCLLPQRIDGIESADYTISCWMNNSYSGQQMIFDQNFDGSHFIQLYMSNGRPYFSTNEVTGSVVGGATTIGDSTWHWVGAKKSGTTGYIRVDGRQDGTGPVKNVTQTDRATICAQRNSSYQSAYWMSYLDELRISNVALSDDWMKAEYYSMKKATFYNGELWMQWAPENT